MLAPLIAKDVRRARRNPIPWLTNLALPLCITALIGLAFGGKKDAGALGVIRFAVVDEDGTRLTEMLRGAANQEDAGRHLDPVFLERAAAMREVEKDRVSAVLIIPKGFTHDYLTGEHPVTLELIKNPAQSIHPAVLEELSGVLVTAMNALARNFQSELPDWRKVVEGKTDFHEMSALMERAGKRLDAARRYLDPPLVNYRKEVKAGETGDDKPGFNLFGYLLAGMAGMFLLFQASTAMIDLHDEIKIRVFARYHTLQERLAPFLAAKVLFALFFLALSAGILLGGGSILFGFQWRQPLPLAAVTLGYVCFSASFMALLVAGMKDEHGARLLTNIAGMFLGIAGGCAFPPQQLPAFMRDHLSPMLPSYWFAETARALQSGTPVQWIVVVVQFLAVSVVLIGLAALLIRRRLHRGGLA